MRRSLFSKILPVFCLFLGGNLPLLAQSLGKPFLENYAPQTYQAAPQNWAIVQDQRGVMYFANDQGVLEYDAKHWNLIPTSNGSAVRSLTIDQQGIIYVGASNELGYLAPDASGQLMYISLTDKIEQENQSFGDVWSVHATPQGVYFQTDNYLFCLQKNQEFRTWHAPENSYFFLSYYVEGELWVHDQANGLMKMQDQALTLVPGGETLAKARVYSIFSYTDQAMLLGTRGRGLVLYRPQGLGSARFQVFESEAHDFVAEHQFYYGRKLDKAHWIICTREGGAIILDKKGKIVRRLDKQMDLMNENVHYAFLDREQNLWLALDNGISKISWNVPITHWDQSLGLSGSVKDIIKFEKEIYTATSTGVFQLQSDRNFFRPIKGIPSTQCWALLNPSIQAEASKLLLIGTNQGIFLIENQEARQMVETSGLAALCFYQVPKAPDYLLVGLKGGLLLLHYEEGEWKDLGLIKGIEDEIYSIVQDKQGSFWLGTFVQGIVKAEIDLERLSARTQRYGTEAGLPSLRDNQVYHLGEQLVFGTQTGLFVYDKNQNRFREVDWLGNEFTQSERGVYQMSRDSRGNLWIADVTNQQFAIGVAQPQEDGTYRWNDIPLRRLPEFSEPTIYVDKEGITWIGGSEGLFRYDSQGNDYFRIYKQKFYTLLRKATFEGDSVVFHGTYYRDGQNKDTITPRRIHLKQPAFLKPVFAFDPNFSIEFEYASPYYNLASGTEYSYMLKVEKSGWFTDVFNDRVEQWSNWSEDTKTQFTNLTEGTYVFLVKTRNVYGREGIPARYQFRIEPPWYRTWYAYLGYLLMSILFVFLIIRVYTARLRRQKRLLEETVEERTHEIRVKNTELEQSKEEILVQAEHLRQANLDITSSISYASRIQEAMLPRLEKVKTAFPDSFIIYKPRDIVSGDFYWFSETLPEPRFVKDPALPGTPSILDGFTGGKKIIAAVDCTGHGVPGAFMSMVGDAYLNQIVNLGGITQPQLILQELDQNIRTALNQQETENLDGMDMAICVISPNQEQLEFAGAKNPLIYIRDGELHQIRGDRYGIGGLRYDEHEERIFARHTIQLDRPTSFYIFSDGMQDQFGGERGKKFMIKRMKKLFLEHYQKPMEEQKQIFEEALADWMQGYNQIDDILVIGFQIIPQEISNQEES